MFYPIIIISMLASVSEQSIIIYYNTIYNKKYIVPGVR